MRERERTRYNIIYRQFVINEGEWLRTINPAAGLKPPHVTLSSLRLRRFMFSFGIVDDKKESNVINWQRLISVTSLFH